MDSPLDERGRWTALVAEARRLLGDRKARQVSVSADLASAAKTLRESRALLAKVEAIARRGGGSTRSGVNTDAALFGAIAPAHSNSSRR
jgi:hypothetical protein